MKKGAKKVAKVAEHFYCSFCDYTTSRINNYHKHCLTAKHIKGAKITEKVAEKYYCDFCDYATSRHFCFNRHCLTAKHIKGAKSAEKVAKIDDNFLKNLIINIMENQNKQQEANHIITERLTDIIKNYEPMNIITNSNNTVNNIQNKFNLNIFLNEECKDAFNMSEFINMIQLTIKDLEVTARLGYTDGITKIIKDKVVETGIKKRPFHCTDIKREIVYVKDNDVWEKENSEKSKMKNMISNVIHKNFQQLSNWQETYPECTDLSSKKSEEYLNIMIQVNGGNQIERQQKEEKILKNLMKEIVVDK